MNPTLEDFCHRLMDDESMVGPERLAARFVRYFGVSERPTLAELKGLMKRAGFGEVSPGPLEDLKGIHFGTPRGECEIYYREDLWDGAKGYTVLHESCEIIHETLCYLHTGSLPQRKVCREADRFAASVLMQREAFAFLAERSGLDVLALQRTFQCSYASVALRLAEVVRSVPLMAVLYEREKEGRSFGLDGAARAPGNGGAADV